MGGGFNPYEEDSMKYVVQIEIGGALGQHECYLRDVRGGPRYKTTDPTIITTPDPDKALVFYHAVGYDMARDWARTVCAMLAPGGGAFVCHRAP
jgi:hypothetical protein